MSCCKMAGACLDELCVLQWGGQRVRPTQCDPPACATIWPQIDIPQFTPQAVIYYKKPFNFLNLGALAYLGGDSALTEVR